MTATAIVGLVMTLIQELLPLVMRAINASKEQHAEILVDLQTACARANDAVVGLLPTLKEHDATADAALDDAAKKKP